MGCGASSPKEEAANEPPISQISAEAAPTQQPLATAPPPAKYSASASVPLSAAEAEETVDLGDDVTGGGGGSVVGGSSDALGITLQLGPAKGGQSTIVHNSGGESVGKSATQAHKSSVAALQSVDLGALHRALEGSGPVSLEALEAAVKQLLPAADVPPKEVLAALFRAWDTDNSGYIERGELVAGCQALCGGDETEKLRLTFSCFDADGDAHLSKEEVKLLLKGSISSAVSALHSGLEFAGEGASVEEMAEEARDAGASLEAEQDGMVRVRLSTAVGVATITVPQAALVDCSSAHLSADAFLDALVQEAFAKHDTDGNATIEIDEFVGFVRSNAFLSVWFGFLAEKEKPETTWRDAHLA